MAAKKKTKMAFPMKPKAKSKDMPEDTKKGLKDKSNNMPPGLMPKAGAMKKAKAKK